MSFLKQPVIDDESADALVRPWHNSCSTDHLAVYNRRNGALTTENQRAFIEAIERKKQYKYGVNYILPVPLGLHDDDIEARLVALDFTKMGTNRSHVMYHKVRFDA